MKLLPIKAGCQALVVWGEQSGAEVTVLFSIDIGETLDICGSTRSWKTPVWRVKFKDGVLGVYRENMLMRIDGDPDTKTKETTKDFEKQIEEVN